MKRFPAVLAVVAVLTWPAYAAAADSAAAPPAKPDADQTENNYYWQGTQLYNLGRLGEAFESFEKAIQRKQNAKESEAYLMQIRQEIVNNAKNRSKERDTVNTGGTNPDSALNIVYVDKGHVRVFIQAKFLFDENTATPKAGAVDVINKVADILQNKEGNRIEITLVDDLDPILHARDVDAERALAVFALINFRRLSLNAGLTAPLPMELKVLILPGDGIGAEVTREAVRVLECVAQTFHHALQRTEALLGGVAIHKTGSPFPKETEILARAADATLMGAVGLPEFDNAPPEKRPEKGLLGIRQALGVYANLRPVRAYPALLNSSPLKNHLVDGTDMIIVRELTGGLYYGTPRGISGEGKNASSVNTMAYTYAEIERVTRMAFGLARKRRKKLSSVDKSNVLETSQLWRRVVTEVAQDFPDVALEHILVDNCAMQLVLNPKRFDVVLTENMFGDILSDEGAVLAGSIGMLPSASIGAQKPSGVWTGLYEPVHGSAPDIAGQNKANPLGAIGSVAAMLEYSFGLQKEAAAVNAAIEKVLTSGRVTADLKPAGTPATTEQVGQALCEVLHEKNA